MKRILTILLALAMIVCLMAGCAKTEAPAQTPAETPAEAPAETPAEAPVEEWKFDKPISLIVPYSAGGTADTVARIICQHLTEELGVTINVINQGGAGGEIGTTEIAAADPDGYTIGVVNNPDICISCVNSPDFEVDFNNDLIYMATYTATGLSLYANASGAYSTLDDFVAYCKANPGTIAVGESGMGSRMMIALIMENLGIEVGSVNFSGSGDLTAAALGNHVDATVAGSNQAGGYISGGWKPIMWGGVERHPDFPDSPLSAEAGVAAECMDVMTVFVAPAGTPQAAVDCLIAAFDKIAADPQTQVEIEGAGCVYEYKSAEVLEQAMADNYVAIEELSSGEYKDFIIAEG